EPRCVIVDHHPDYFATRLGRELAREGGLPLFEIQHHRAHFTAVLAENALLETEDPVLGVIWDGTGLGDDGQIWGGEFFLYEGEKIKRLAHLSYFDFIAGDKMPREPRISALAATAGMEESEATLREKFSEVEWKVYQRLLSRPGSLKCSSMGRLVDAGASLLELADRTTYEGEGAMLLEQLAVAYLRREGLNARTLTSYLEDWDGAGNIPVHRILSGLIADRKRKLGSGLIAVRFHFTLVEAIRQVASHHGLTRLAFSGGVLQNSLIVDFILHRLAKNYKLYWHRQLSPNDECISFGQLYGHHLGMTRSLATPTKAEGV
ncbi:MAG: hypothetical protein R3350_00085, partial [Saprospiraceae bacterium]|nr:hypothetical protein [Saprospiraceae bacterium]